MQTKRISEVSEQLGVSAQTIRNYLKIGSDFFSERATRKTGKRFTDSDIEQLQTVRDLLSDGLRYDDNQAISPPLPAL